MIKIFFLIELLFFSFHLLAQKDVSSLPAWINFEYRLSKYPNSIYVSGFATEEYYGNETKEELMDRIKGFARIQLIESIHVTIKSITTLQIETLNTVTNDYFKHTSVSLSKINLTNLTTEIYFDEKEKIGYAFAYAKKSSISDYSRNNILTNKNQIERKIENAKIYENQGNNQLALKNYLECYSNIREIEESQTLIITFENTTIDNPVLYVSVIDSLKRIIETAIQTIYKKKQASSDDIAYFIASGIKLQIEKTEKPICLKNISYEDTKTGSPFAKRFTSELEQKLIELGFKVVSYEDAADANNQKPELYQLSGTYWEEGEKIKIITLLKEPTIGNAIASCEGNISKLWLEKNQIPFKPQNINEINQNQNILNTNEITGSGLNLEFTTNKGDDNIMYTEELDTMKFYILVNRPCYIRIIYYLADGQIVLMLDNLKIDKNQVNKVQELPNQFEIAPPFGVETIQLIAQTQPFKMLSTKPYGDYKLIVEKIPQILANSRGFKPIGEKDGIAEKRLIVTTLPKNSE
jgi:tetratricopeptide (TPR) repeat protein